MSDHNDFSGMAALTICEALLLAMNDHKLLPEREIMGVLRDAATTHEKAAAEDADNATHRAVAELINQIMTGDNQGKWARYPPSMGKPSAKQEE